MSSGGCVNLQTIEYVVGKSAPQVFDTNQNFLIFNEMDRIARSIGYAARS